MAKLLIQKGVDVNAKSNDGKTALHRAIMKGYKKVADLLRKHGGRSHPYPDIITAWEINLPIRSYYFTLKVKVRRQTLP